jgi:hypothetical protein
VEWGEGWHQGVIGITAGRLAEKYGVPTLVIATDGENAKGSGRSPENVDLYQALKRCGNLFSKFGGHPRAGGFSLASEALPRLAQEMTSAANDLRDGPAPVWVDGCLTLAQVDLALVRELERMEPFGEANPKPRFLLEGVDIVHQRLVGRSGDHLQLEVEQLGLRRRAIAFRQADLTGKLRTQEFRYDLRCELGRDNFRGQEQLRLQVSGVVEPACQESDENSPVIDLRHLRGRRRALQQWLGREGEFSAVCRDPEKACAAYPDFAGRFLTYDSRPQKGGGILLLSPPPSKETLEEFMQAVRPATLVVLFGCSEIERALAACQELRWDRDQAVSLWRELKRMGRSVLETPAVRELAEKRLKFTEPKTEVLLSAFLETEALREEPGGSLVFSTANGTKLEQTKAFSRWREERDKLILVRAFFSGPDLRGRLTQCWTWLDGERSARQERLEIEKAEESKLFCKA